MVDYTEIPHDSDLWELFARDFLEEIGFHIETPPDRGADGGKDILVIEKISGLAFSGQFRWLVSCKHFAKSGNSVNETRDEPNVLERLASFDAQGFMGFYSTLPSAGLNNRLRQLRDEGKLQAYRIFDHKMIENHLISSGYSKLMLRYFPDSYRQLKPLHLITDQYEPLNCETCGKDLLPEMFFNDYYANLVFVYKWDRDTGKEDIQDVYVACKGKCDGAVIERANQQGLMTSWLDISDVVIPLQFLRLNFAIMNRLRDGNDIYIDEAWDKLRKIIIALAQKVLRFTTERERERFKTLLEYQF